MQPLISPVDHESITNSYNAEDQHTTTESTPLISNNVMVENFQPMSALNKAVIFCLLLTLIVGVIIGTYLLSQQSDVFPSVEAPLQLILRSQWDLNNITTEVIPLLNAFHVIITATNTDQCYGWDTCRKLLMELKKNQENETNVLSYNFLISSNGLTFEALGWRKRSLLYPELRDSSYIFALIGNFTKEPPTTTQVQETLELCSESVRQGYLKSSYDIVGKNGKLKFHYLFQPFTGMSNWNTVLSDNVFH